MLKFQNMHIIIQNLFKLILYKKSILLIKLKIKSLKFFNCYIAIHFIYNKNGLKF